MNTELRNRIINHVPAQYDCGWDEDSAVFAPPAFGIDSNAEDEVVAQNYALNTPEVAEHIYVQFMQGMEALLTCCEKAREEQELAALDEELDKYSAYESDFHVFGNCVGSRKLAGVEHLAEPSCRYYEKKRKPTRGKKRKERFTRKTHNASRGRICHGEQE